MYYNPVCIVIGECRDEALPDRLASSDLNPKPSKPICVIIPISSITPSVL